MRNSSKAFLLFCLSANALLACSTSVGGGGSRWKGGGSGGAASSCEETPATRSPDTSLTVCSRTVPEEIAPALGQCTPDSPKPSNCTAHEPCGQLTGCTLERNQTISGSPIPTTYQEGPRDYEPPDPPHWPGSPAIRMDGWMHGASTAWFPRPVNEAEQTLSHTDQPGSCGIPGVRSLTITAISSKQFGIEANAQGNAGGPDKTGVWNYAYWCGACAEMVGRSGKRVRVQIVTQCTGCDADKIDTPGNFAGDSPDTPASMIDDPTNADQNNCGGSQPVDWRIVPCEVCGGIVVEYLVGFSHWTPAIRIHNHRLPIVNLEFKQNGNWKRIQRSSVNNFVLPSSDQPLELRVTAIDGSTITGIFPAFEPGKHYEATSQF